MKKKNESPTVEVVKPSVEAKGFIQRFKTAMTKPMNILVAGLLFLLTLGMEYTFSRAMDLVWEVESPDEVLQLNSELQTSTTELNRASQDLRELVASIEANSVENPKLQARLNELSERLMSFDSLLETTSTNTAKVAVFSKALQDDYIRMKEFSDGRVEGMPNLLLKQHEALRLCGGILAFSVYEIGSTSVRVVQNGRTSGWEHPGTRIKLKGTDNGYIDYLGIEGDHAKFKLVCEA